MYSQVFFTASVREISETPRKSCRAGETGDNLRMPVGRVAFGFSAFEDETGFATEDFVVVFFVVDEDLGVAVFAAAISALQPLKTLDVEDISAFD